VKKKAGIVEIDTTGGPGFGFEHFKQYDFLRDREFGFEHLKQYDFLRDKEIVLTFDGRPGRSAESSERLPGTPPQTHALRRTRINTIQLGRLQTLREFGLRAATTNLRRS